MATSAAAAAMIAQAVKASGAIVQVPPRRHRARRGEDDLGSEVERKTPMRSMPFQRFRGRLDEAVAKVVEENRPLRVRQRCGKDFVIISASEWEREQETLHVLQNRSLMDQIESSLQGNLEGSC